MIAFPIALAMAAASHAPVIEPLQVFETEDIACTSDEAICVKLDVDDEADAVALSLYRGRGKDSVPLRSYSIPIQSGAPVSLWPYIIRNSGGHPEAIFGTVATENAMYSGGGGNAALLSLHYLETDSMSGEPEAANVILTVPQSSYIMIRACFSESDYKNRRGACHDEYNFTGKLTVAPQNAGHFPPILRYETLATATPGNSRRSEDNSSGKRLTKADLKTAIDPRCTYRRTATYDQEVGAYIFDRPLPDCSDYTAASQG